ncbi:type II/IV secretion system protein [Candidatus Parcubacteria bacterium]|nr:MAG: type II/IV secretion system protein [Candidatus Parcubacteria bacterium]
MKVEDQQLKAFILDQKLVPEDKLKKAEEKAKKAKRPIEEILREDNLINEIKLAQLKAYILGIPFIDLEKEEIKPDILYTIPEPIARRHNIIAYKKNGRELEVAMLDPSDLQTIEFIRKKSGLRLLPRLTTPSSIKNALRQYQKTLEAEFGEIIKRETGAVSAAIQEGEDHPEKEELQKMAEDLPIVRIVDTLIKHAVLQNATDIHIEPSEKEVVVRYRIDGLLHDAMVLPSRVHPGIVARIKVLSNLQLDEHRLPQDGRFKLDTDEGRVAFRVSIMPTHDGEKIVMRLLHENPKGFTLESIGFLPDQVEVLQKHLRRTTGMILATGPTGSGKTTTLYTVLEILNKPEVNIVTVEDPIEYRIARINQTQVKPQIGLTFANGLRSIVRQDPDVIMVGEIRDTETASLAVNASLTGHLVLSTLHTNSSAGSFPRLIDMKIEPFLIASTVNVVIAQRLVRRLCSEREKYFLNEKEIGVLEKELKMDRILEALRKSKVVPAHASFKNIPFYRPKPNKDCPDGYKGRIGIHEVLEVTETIKSLINRNATSDEIEEQARKEGMETMLEAGFIKAAQGITSIEEVLRVIHEE